MARSRKSPKRARPPRAKRRARAVAKRAARARARAGRAQRGTPAAPPPSPSAPPPPPPSPAERALLDLACQLSVVAAEPEPPPTTLRAALEALFAGCGPDSAIVDALLDGWRAVRRDKRATLALGWAREQLRLAIAELLAREVKGGRLPAGAPLEAVSWMVVLTAEAAGHELPGSTTDRVDALLALAGIRVV